MALLAIALAAGSAWGQSARDLLMPSVLTALDQAEKAMTEGEWGKAEALIEVARPSVVKVEVDLTRAPAAQKLDCLRAANRAMDAWTEALGGAVEWVVVPATQAQVRIQFRPDVAVGGADTAGRADIVRQLASYGWGAYGPHLAATLQVRTTSIGGGAHDIKAMTHTAAHELGHVLGLSDSGMAAGFMGPLFGGQASSQASAQEVQVLLAHFDRADLLLAQAQSARLRGL